jgi:hypothetical protein
VNTNDVLGAQQFVASVDLSGVPTHSLLPGLGFAESPTPFIPRPNENQSIVVASQLQAFAKGVASSTRLAIQNSVLLAQLVAQKQASPDDFVKWYASYFETLNKIGWLIREQGFALFDSGATQTDVHEALLQLAAGLMGGPATTAFQLVAATVGALQKLKQGDQTIAIFSRETEHAQAGRFQVSVAEQESDGGLAISLMAFRLHASTTVTSVLFFKFASNKATLEHFSGKVGVNEGLLEAVAEQIAGKVRDFIEGNVRILEI